MWVCRLPVHIGPAERTVFTKIFGEFVTASRADVGIGPYSQSGRRVRIRRKTPASGCIPCGRTESSAPTGKLEALYHKTQMFYRIISSSASGETSSVMPKRSMA